MSQALLGGAPTFTAPPSTANFFKQPDVPPDVPPAAQGASAGAIPVTPNPAAPPPTAEPPQQPAPSPAQAAGASPDVQWQAQMQAMQQSYAQREQQWMQAMQQQQAELEAARKAQAEYEAYKQQIELQQKLASDETFNSLETVAPDEARRIAQIVTANVQNTLDQQRQAWAQQQEEMRQRQEAMQKQLYNQNLQRASQEVLAKHPDFYALYQTPQFQQFMTQREGLSSKTREQVATEEFYAGNTAYVIDLLDRYKGRAPAAQMQQVPPVQVAGAAVQPGAAPSAPQMTLAELNTLMQTRQITPEEYRQRLNELRAAPPQPPV